MPTASKTQLVALTKDDALLTRLQRHEPAVERLARVEGIAANGDAPRQAAQIVVGGATFALPLAGIIDFSAEEARLKKEIDRVENEISRIDNKLANENFIARAPEDVVQAERDKRAAYQEDGKRLSAALERLKQAA